MTSRYLFKHELLSLFDKKARPRDIEEGQVIGVTEVCNYSMVIEEKKIEGVHEDILKQRYSHVIQEMSEGKIWILDLTADTLFRLLIDEDFFNDHCDKKSNPYELAGRFSLHYDSSYSYWTENVYEEAYP